MKVEIKNRRDGTVLFSAEVEDSDPAPLRTALIKASCIGANLRHANLNVDIPRARHVVAARPANEGGVA